MANISRGKHIRWEQKGLLSSKVRYTDLDVVKAAVLDECNRVLRPSLAATTWRQIEGDLEAATGKRAEIVVVPETHAAQLVRSDAELLEALPRNEAVVIIEIEGRMEQVQSRLLTFRAAQRSGPLSPSAALP